ncbi:MAG: DNA repair protein RecN [Gammaproteobacteria bacterium]|nr:MAG: DNA repair protein RecN [Gammaproteobacteria bacterium]
MLAWIHLRDFVLVDRLELELAPGMTALTGETGAGKSILVDAIGLALGDRADARVVRPGADRAEIQLGFELDGQAEVRAWLDERELLDADTPECQLRRVVSREGRSRAWINGRPCPVGLLRELGRRLVALHGQHAHQALTRREVQRRLLDRQAETQSLLEEMAARHARWLAARERLEHLRGHAQELRQRIEFLRYQLEELETLDPRPGEERELRREAHRLGAAGTLQALCAQLVATLYEDEDAAWTRISRAMEALSRHGDGDPEFASVVALLGEAAAPLEEAVAALRRLGAHLEPDPARLDEVNTRLAALQRLARKHGIEPDALPEQARRLREELEALTAEDADPDRLAAEVRRLHEAALATAETLHARRAAAAGRITPQVQARLAELGMPQARFRVRIEADPERLQAHGMDRVEFEVCTNPGQPWGPLSRIASGGELSRIGLALQLVLGDAGPARVRIFDEVDAGIGGGVAEIVGRRLRELGERGGQVLCVTHLPQVAAQAHHHLQVEKHPEAGGTVTRITPLDGEARVEELARMLGGVRITTSTRAHAREMLATSRAPAPARGRRNSGAGSRRRGSGSGRG